MVLKVDCSDASKMRAVSVPKKYKVTVEELVKFTHTFELTEEQYQAFMDGDEDVWDWMNEELEEPVIDPVAGLVMDNRWDILNKPENGRTFDSFYELIVEE